ncbi:gamma-glutamylcyclotransferase family protein [Parafrankia sp. EUN1f]|uniref:gamma-glutamylcyclotransferase family protein n=1 Tax=Parafrankia sp. EUN1f TaxID=102897 RepID=UPI0001C43E1D|nr:gamma-glutamylcyclotransferase family protein [Parafrankia sp. EUN1f]EFC85605.1 AIG2 family protein [Parafrankia sp. EUN1f]
MTQGVPAGAGASGGSGPGRAPTLFVYGTLQFPEVVEALLARRPVMSPASAAGWRAAELRSQTYPGLVPAGPTEICAGACLHGLTSAERELLDLFEGDYYEAREVSLVGGEVAVAYLWRGPVAQVPVLASNWDAGRFAARHLAEFVRRCQQWRAQVVPEPPR